MKKELSLFVFFVIIGLFATSCKKDNINENFSCNPEINQWAKTNLKSVQLLTRDELTQLPISKQRAAWRTLSAERKLELWKDKYAEMNKLNWTIEERNHLELLVNELKVEFFLEPTSIERIEIQNIGDQFLLTWISFAQSELHWNQHFLYSIGFRLDNPVSNNRLLETNSSNLGDEQGPPPPGPVECACNASDPGNDFCGAFDMLECVSGACVENDGCGWWWSHSCDGLCKWKNTH